MNLKGDCSNLELEEGRIRGIYCRKSRIVVLNEPQDCGGNWVRVWVGRVGVLEWGGARFGQLSRISFSLDNCT